LALLWSPPAPEQSDRAFPDSPVVAGEESGDRIGTQRIDEVCPKADDSPGRILAEHGKREFGIDAYEIVQVTNTLFGPGRQHGKRFQIRGR